MGVKIESGLLLNNKRNLFSFISDKFIETFNDLFDGSSVSNVKEESNPNGDKYGKGASITLEDEHKNKINVIIFPEKERGKNTLILECNGEQSKQKNVDSDDVVTKIKEFVEDVTGGNVEINSSKHKIHAKFKRICGDTEDTIKLVGIKCDEDPHTALMVIDNVLNDDEIMSQVDEGCTAFDIVDDGQTLEVEPTEDFESNPFEYLLSFAYAYWNTLKAVHWNARGSQFKDLHEYADSLAYDVIYQIDMLSEWCVQYYGVVFDSVHFMSELESIPVDSGFEYAQGMDIIQEIQHQYLCAMQLVREQLDPAIQSVIDDWMMSISKQADYFVQRTRI